MSKLELGDNGVTILMKMSEGNPGALTALMRMMKEGAEIDPVSAFGGLGGILALDTHGIYGSRIWMLYSDVCDKDLTKMLGVLRGVQLGLLDEAAMQRAIDDFGAGLDVDAVVKLVKTELPEFAAA